MNKTFVIWNTEWASPGSKREKTIKSIVKSYSPDIICITEGYIASWENEGNIISAEADYGYSIKDGRRKALIVSNDVWSSVDTIGSDKFPPGRFCSGVTSNIRVYGVCVPWKSAHVRTGQKNRENWEDHLTYLSALKSIIDVEEQTVIVCGDYNQRIPRKYSPENVYESLINTFQPDFNITTTGNIPEIGRPVIDHFAHKSQIIVNSIIGIPSTFNDIKLSDHDGLVINFEY